MTAENNWEHTFEGLPTYSNGKLIEYTIDEKDVPAGWSGNILDPITFERTADDKDPTVVERHLTLVNIDLTEVTGTKVWADEQAEHPDIQLQLFRKIDDGEAEPVGEPQLLDNGATTYTWSNLPVGDAEGNLYTYFVEEVATPEGYEKTTSDDGLTITNSPTSTPETSTPVTTPETSTPVTTPETSTPVTTPETSTPVTTPVTTPETSTPVTTPETSTPVTTPVTTPETSTPVTTPETSTPVTTPETTTITPVTTIPVTPPSDPPATTTPPRPTGPLALTGANVGWLAGLGLLALVAGGFLVLRRTR
ncbi:Cna B-type domain-containing protein [Corynebacterium spheniscorum]|nr:Cna B-type domain-containing protein [Corynebacterium spheniscorum]